MTKASFRIPDPRSPQEPPQESRQKESPNNEPSPLMKDLRLAGISLGCSLLLLLLIGVAVAVAGTW